MISVFVAKAYMSSAYVAGTTWFDARATAAVVLGEAPGKIKMTSLNEYDGTAFFRTAIKCDPSKHSEIEVYNMVKKKGRECMVINLPLSCPELPVSSGNMPSTGSEVKVRLEEERGFKAFGRKKQTK